MAGESRLVPGTPAPRDAGRTPPPALGRRSERPRRPEPAAETEPSRWQAERAKAHGLEGDVYGR